MTFRVQEAASRRIDDIYRYTRDRWGIDQADTYLIGLFEAFAGVSSGQVISRPIPAEFGVSGSVFRYRRHFVYWKTLDNGDAGIVTVLHQRMHQVGRLREDFGWDGAEGPDHP